MDTRTEAAEVLAAARARDEERAAAHVPIDYAGAGKMFPKQKARLTRAQNSGDPDRVVLECRRAVREWNAPPFNGAWPDDWGRWQSALDDVLGWGNSVDLHDLD